MNNENFFSHGKSNSHDEKDGGIDDNEMITVPVIEEQLTVEKKTITTGRIEIKKEVAEAEEILDITLFNDEYSIERLPVNEYVETAPRVRQDGNTMIIPVVKEVIIKRLLVTEEIRITKRTIETTEQQKVLLRKEKVTVTRTPSQEE